MSFRPGSRIFSSFRPFFQRANARRHAGTAAGAEPAGFQKFWNSPIGPKTVHFWAPVMKWGMVLAGASDFSRPAESLSFTQNFALMCTGAIWTRWCFVIRPKNVALAAVNFLVFCVGATQVGRIYAYNKSIEGTEGQAKGEMKDLKHTAEKAEQKAEKALK
ncbi:UPF0041-domain-containing protein [Alternaria alternata]|uniref:Mitochondrial pyruvate carrier n=3 Tax=Alternaria sect. Alternaria TaxID=2499237 RepID=A0A177DZM5_ALTAL|nr:UPF0041-domain-containing protein [Alternaria alternata]XP_051584445.1 uncharacterized protein J4E82_009552 [Alternaria postmessia]KAB2103665.1 hypothetical protein AG0111_0g8379 [Alternaria gaisen]RII08990.1 hypothetical protein CUC08_Gglean007388 [Alternaria sp. MG1]RYN30086.1 hypothetical protein AA0115_g4957 [Alternaria tenuissima]KAH8627804.1 UPF0041-domain-containing protein [Alternaria alternata]KAI5371742.1 hypothetical protein J4E82_009552 [Alternaria postmessia]